jgi:hypothetical protein
MPESQSYQNHVRFDPVWHFFIAPAMLVNIIVSVYETIHHWPEQRALFLWWVFLSIVLFMEVGRARQHSLIAQDRIIRLEEKLRFHALLPPDLLARSQTLSVRQIIALRFVADAELPEMVRRTLDENLTPKQIKQTIQSWRPDYLRV